MTEKKIEVVVDLDGNVEIEASGFSNNECEKETAALEASLGSVTGRKRKNYGGVAPVVNVNKVGKA